MRAWAAIGLAALLAGCATPYQEMGYLGGVQATQIASDTFQITSRANAFTDADVMERHTLRKAAETVLAHGFDGFAIQSHRDRSRHIQDMDVTRDGLGEIDGVSSTNMTAPGETVLVRAFKGPKPPDAGPGVYDARDVLRYVVPTTTQP